MRNILYLIIGLNLVGGGKAFADDSLTGLNIELGLNTVADEYKSNADVLEIAKYASGVEKCMFTGARFDQLFAADKKDMAVKKPKISVILPSYNGERYIAQSIQSVIDQTEQDWELIIVNDGSTDRTLEIATEFAKKDKRIKVISNKKNSKLPASLNEGFRNARGEYLTWTSDDNYYKPDALNKLSKYLDEHPKTDLVSMASDFVDENDKFIRSFESHFKYKRCPQGLLLSCNVGAAFMYRKTIADKVGEYDTDTFCAEDYDYWCRIALIGKIDYTPDNIYVYRRQPDSLTSTKQPQVREKTKYIQRKYAEAFFNKFNFTALDKVRFYRNVLHEVNSTLGYLVGLYSLAVDSVLSSDLLPKTITKDLRARLLTMDKYSFSIPNKEYKQMKNILVILGTRPEAIKLAPVILNLRKDSAVRVLVCNTEQQKDLSNQTLNFFGINADFKLDAMQHNQTLADVQSRILTELSDIYKNNKIDATIVQGDTMTVFCGALASFYNRVPVFHVEAGLRSYDLFEPFPEEAMRQMTARITDLHFAPTQLAYEALLKENISPKKIVCTGNTVIDALSCLSEKTMEKARNKLLLRGVSLNDKLVLVTVHRRENHGDRLDRILEAITLLTKKYSDHQFVVPVHPNPNVYTKIHAALEKLQNVVLTEPLDYPELVCLMKNSKLILTDSGGLQEESPTFGTPVLVMRYKTERTEGVDAGFSKLVGADIDKIISESEAILSRDKSETRLDGSKNPYGDGHATEKISIAIKKFWK